MRTENFTSKTLHCDHNFQMIAFVLRVTKKKRAKGKKLLKQNNAVYVCFGHPPLVFSYLKWMPKGDLHRAVESIKMYLSFPVEAFFNAISWFSYFRSLALEESVIGFIKECETVESILKGTEVKNLLRETVADFQLQFVDIWNQYGKIMCSSKAYACLHRPTVLLSGWCSLKTGIDRHCVHQVGRWKHFDSFRTELSVDNHKNTIKSLNSPVSGESRVCSERLQQMDSSQNLFIRTFVCNTWYDRKHHCILCQWHMVAFHDLHISQIFSNTSHCAKTKW